MGVFHGLERLGAKLTVYTERWVPDAWVICMILTAAALLLAVVGATYCFVLKFKAMPYVGGGESFTDTVFEIPGSSMVTPNRRLMRDMVMG